MEITLKGDREFDDVPSLKTKALRINLNENIYGTFAEIGAGQELGIHALARRRHHLPGVGGEMQLLITGPSRHQLLVQRAVS